VLAAILTTIAIGILLRGLIVLIWSAAQQHPLEALHLSNPPIEIVAGARISTCAALIVLMTALVYGGLFTFLRFGRWGVRMRAAGQNPLLASQRGINLHAIYALAWALAEVLAIHYINPLLSDVVPFLVIIATLIVRPWGLFGTREELDRV
jgi:branched-chain amino acid transport system permease protein